MSSSNRKERWFHLDLGSAHDAVMRRAEELERQNSYLFDRFYRLRCLYDPYLDLDSEPSGGTNRYAFSEVSENLIASNVDTAVSSVASAKIRPRLVTSGADWTTQRKAKKLSLYLEQLGELCDIHEVGTEGFKESALIGTGLAMVEARVENGKGVIDIEEVLADDVLVNEVENRHKNRPRQQFLRRFIDREDLMARYPDHEEEIENLGPMALRDTRYGGRLWANTYALEEHQLVVIEGWYLGNARTPGRHIVCTHGLTMKDEEYTDGYFPIARMPWSERLGYYGIGGAERIAGHQRRLNKFNWQMDRWIDQFAMPTIWYHHQDANLQVQTANALGNRGIYRVEPPQVKFPPAMSPDMLLRRQDLRQSGYEEFGSNRLTATASKPAGLESGAALREYRDATGMRHAFQIQAHERFVLRLYWLVLAAAKKLGDKAPRVYSQRSKEWLEWKDVDLGEVKTQMQAASALPNTPAGRRQLAIELAQAGLISQEESRRLLGPLDPLDLEQSLSLYVAALEHCDWLIEKMLDGQRMWPSEYMNLPLVSWRVQATLLKAEVEGAPEEVLGILREFLDQTSWLQSQAQAAMAPPAGPEAGGNAAQPQAALAPQAMDLVAQ